MIIIIILIANTYCFYEPSIVVSGLHALNSFNPCNSVRYDYYPIIQMWKLRLSRIE